MTTDLHLVGEYHWTDDAACKGMPLALFFPEAGTPLDAARSVCDGCPVKDECGEFALWAEDYTHAESVGVYGALSAAQREVILRERRRLKRLAAA